MTLAAVGYFGLYTQQLDLSWLHDHFLPVMAAMTVLAFTLAILLYAASFRKGCLLALGGDTGVPVYDFFMGR